MSSKLVELYVELLESSKVNGLKDVLGSISWPSKILLSELRHPAVMKLVTKKRTISL
tara:strand:+ start:1669 stop:1839 length:171 start_codon:yes stop_codon:yes gene_type:complete